MLQLRNPRYMVEVLGMSPHVANLAASLARTIKF
jgi:hypothetical protein